MYILRKKFRKMCHRHVYDSKITKIYWFTVLCIHNRPYFFNMNRTKIPVQNFSNPGSFQGPICFKSYRYIVGSSKVADDPRRRGDTHVTNKWKDPSVNDEMWKYIMLIQTHQLILRLHNTFDPKPFFKKSQELLVLHTYNALAMKLNEQLNLSTLII